MLIRIADKEQLTPTSEFKYAHWDFEYFNQVQSAVVEHSSSDANIVIAAATSCGKTVMGEIFMADEIRRRGGKAIYVGPLKALAKEKLDDWTSPEHHFSKLNIAICTGDYRLTNSRIEEMNKSNVIVMTPEMLASRCRNQKSEKSTFLKEVGVIVFDESHLLTVPSRGDHIEVALMKMVEINPNVRIVFLSATMPNVDEIAGWVSKITNRDTVLIESSYRPSPLQINYHTYYDGDSSYEEKEMQKVATAVGLVNHYSQDKFLIFVHSKRTGKLMVDSLSEYGIETDFHNADLDAAKRHKIEERFKSDPKFRVIVATSTLAWGLNTPSRRVIVLGVNRGMSMVENYDIQQMCVSGDSRVLMSDGTYCLIKNIQIEDSICCIDENQKLSKAKVLSVFHSKGFAKEIKFNNGSKIIASNHPMLSWEQNWISSDELNVHDKICITDTIPHMNTTSVYDLFVQELDNIRNLYVSVDQKVFNEFCSHFKTKKSLCSVLNWPVKSYNRCLRRGRNIPYKLAKKLKFTGTLSSKNGSRFCIDLIKNEKFAWALGMLATDGNIKLNTTHSCIRLGLKNVEMIDTFCSLFPKMKIHRYKNKKGMNCCEIHSFVLANLVSAIGITPKKTRTISVPKLMNLSTTSLKWFLGGVIDGDGSVNQETVRICTASSEFAYQIKEMLLRCSIRSTVCFFKGSGKVMGYICDTGHFIVSFPRSYFSKLKKYSIKLSSLGQCDVIKNSRPKKGDLFYTRVKSIKDVGEQELFNLTVDSTSTFIVEDLITHNCGRAGRPRFDPKGDAHILVPESKKNEAIYKLKQKTKIISQLLADEGGHHKTLAFHVVSEIHHGSIRTREEFHTWFEKSLAHHQNAFFIDADLDNLIDLLVRSKAVVFEDGVYKTTAVGNIASMFYFSPFDVADLKRNFKEVFDKNWQNNDIALAMALGNVDSQRFGIVNKAERAEMSKFQKQAEILFGQGKLTDSAIKAAFGYHNLLNGVYNDTMNALQSSLRLDLDRTMEVVNAIDTMSAKWDKKTFFSSLRNRLLYGVPEHLLGLCQIPSVGRVRAERLAEAGINSLEDFCKAEIPQLGKIMKIKDEKAVKKIHDEAKLAKIRKAL